MKRIRTLLLIVSSTVTGLAAVAQISPPANFRFLNLDSENLSLRVLKRRVNR